MSSRPITEQAILSALQAMATNPDYSDFMRTMEQHLPCLRMITLPHISITNVPTPSLNSISHANTATDQPGHPQYGTSKRSHSPHMPRLFLKEEDGERRPESRKRNERFPTRLLMPPPQNVRNSPSSNPPPDKKGSNEKTPSRSSKSSQLKSVVSEASVLPPPPPSQLPEPTPPPQSSSRDNLLQRATPRPQTSHAHNLPPSGNKPRGVLAINENTKSVMVNRVVVRAKKTYTGVERSQSFSIEHIMTKLNVSEVTRAHFARFRE